MQVRTRQTTWRRLVVVSAALPLLCDLGDASESAGVEPGWLILESRETPNAVFPASTTWLAQDGGDQMAARCSSEGGRLVVKADNPEARLVLSSRADVVCAEFVSYSDVGYASVRGETRLVDIHGSITVFADDDSVLAVRVSVQGLRLDPSGLPTRVDAMLLAADDEVRRFSQQLVSGSSQKGWAPGAFEAKGDVISVMGNVDERGQRQGRWTVVRGERIWAKSDWVDGSREGAWTLFSESGQLKCTGRVADGLLHGRFLGFDGSNLIQSAFYVHGRMHGVQEMWFPSGALRAKHMYRWGTRHGESESFYEDGQPRSRGAFWQGRRTGPRFYWNQDGSVRDLEIRRLKGQ